MSFKDNLKENQKSQQWLQIKPLIEAVPTQTQIWTENQNTTKTSKNN